MKNIIFDDLSRLAGMEICMDKKQLQAIFKYVVLCGAILILLVFLLWMNELPLAFLEKLVGILRPIIIGGGIAFILNKPLNRIQRLYLKLFAKRGRFTKKGKERTYYGISIVTTYLLFVGFVAAIIGFVVPQLISSVKFFADNFDSYYKNFNRFAQNLAEQYDLSSLEKLDIMGKFYSWLSGLTEMIPNIISTTFGITKNIISGFADIFIGLIFSIYVLADKKKLKSQTGRFFRAVLSEKNYTRLVDYYNLTSNTFSQYINGQLVDAFIVGCLCLIGMTIFGFEYALLISVIIAVTNLIPIFGPIIGVVPGALILLLVNPLHAVWFVVMIIVLQQIDGNIIYPRIVGGSVGLSPVWTMAAVLLGGGLFGVPGMVLGVPAMSILYIIAGRFVSKRLMRKKAAKMGVTPVSASEKSEPK